MAKTTETYEVNLSDEEWRKRLTADQYAVLRRHGTERAGTSPLDKRYDPGTYLCAGCGQQLFASLEGAVATSTDHKLIYPRTEVHCSRCGGHLGHVFEDGPAPTGQRFCMNGVALKFEPKP